MLILLIPCAEMPSTSVSVIIPALNAASTIAVQLEALSRQDYSGGLDVVVVDNGSTDDTVQTCLNLQSDLASLRVVHCTRLGTGCARNMGARHTVGDALLFCDADDEVNPGWVAAMVDGLRRSDAVGGRIENERLNGTRPDYMPRHPEGLPVAMGFLPRALTANLGVRRSAFESLHGFNEAYDYGSDDTEFCWRLQLAGFTLTYAPEAVVHYRHRSTLRSVAVKSYRANHSRGRLFQDYGPQGMPQPRLLGALARWGRLAVATPAVPFSPRLRWWWVEQVAAAAGRVSGSLAFGVRYL